jgi:hypothetical protein
LLLSSWDPDDLIESKHKKIFNPILNQPKFER